MISSLAMIFLGGLLCAAVCSKIGLPRIIGMLLAGIMMGPHVLGLLDRSILGVSADLRQMALVIILLKAGLSLDVKSLKRVGRPAFLMTFVPASCEILAFVLLAPPMLGLSHIEAAVMGSVLAAVSPAVVVPKMVALTEQGYGVKKGIPQMILAGASMDDVFVIVLFTSFVGLAQGGHFSAFSLLSIPISIALGILSGLAPRHGAGKAVSLPGRTEHTDHNKGVDSFGLCFFAGKPGGLARRDCAAERPVGGHEHGGDGATAYATACGTGSIAKVFQALDGCRADFVRPGGCCCGYFLCGLGRHWCHCYDFFGPGVPCLGSCFLHDWHNAYQKGTAVLHDCLSA